MQNTPAILPILISSIAKVIEHHAVELTELDQAIGDGDHVSNLQRGLQALQAQGENLALLDWPQAFQKIGMTLMSSVGGASGSLYGTLFMSMGKSFQAQTDLKAAFAEALLKGVEAMKLRGKADRGEKTMLDVLIPVAEYFVSHAGEENVFDRIKQTAIAGAESTRDMLATKGRASFLGERSKGYIDAGAKSSQVMICAIIDALATPT